MPVSLLLFSDPLCPWCWLGKRRLEHAISNLGMQAEVSLKMASYMLSPREVEPSTVMQHLREKYGRDEAGVREMFARVSEAAREEGLSYDFEKAVYCSSFDAHRLLKQARSEGKDFALLERLHQAHFTEGADLSNHPTLAKLAKDVGMDAEGAALALASGAYAQEVELEHAEAMQIGVRGVPFFIFNEEFAVSGAQPLGVFERALNQARGTAKAS